MGYDASVGEYCNMIEKGILDPLKVVSRRAAWIHQFRTNLVDPGPNRAH